MIWGVDCSEDDTGADVAQSKVMISEVDRFKGWLEGAVSSCTVPPHRLVRHHVIKHADTNDGFVISLLPKSDDAPHQTVLKDLNYKYFIRAGSSFVPCPHAVLAGMFGRRPQARVFPDFIFHKADVEQGRITVKIEIRLYNGGAGIAEDLFMHQSVINDLGGQSRVRWDKQKTQDWTYWTLGGKKMSMISKSHVRIPPEGDADPVETVLRLRPPFSDDLRIECVCGSRDSPLCRFTIGLSKDSINASYSELQKRLRDGFLTDADRLEFTKKFLGSGDRENAQTR